MLVKALTLEDLPSVEKLIKARSKTLAVGQEFQQTHTKMSLLNAQDLLACGATQGQLYGAFEGEDLVGTLTIVISKTQPCYFVRKAYTAPGVSLSTLPDLFSAAITAYESMGYKRFYTMYNEKDIALYHRLWRTRSTLRNYLSYTDMVVPPNVRPKHSDLWELLFGRSLYPEPMAIRGFVRKDATLFLHHGRELT